MVPCFQTGVEAFSVGGVAGSESPTDFCNASDTVVLSNGSRTLTTLHVAHLRAAIKGNQTVLSGGPCQPDEYYGPPVTTPPANGSAGSIGGGIALTGEICPLSGNAAGLPASTIAQTDEFSGGQTMTEVPLIVTVSGLQPGTYTAKWTLTDTNGDTRTMVTQFIEQR